MENWEKIKMLKKKQKKNDYGFMELFFTGKTKKCYNMIGKKENLLEIVDFLVKRAQSVLQEPFKIICIFFL